MVIFNDDVFAEDANYTICESCHAYVHVEDVLCAVDTGETFCFICADEHEHVYEGDV